MLDVWKLTSSIIELRKREPSLALEISVYLQNGNLVQESQKILHRSLARFAGGIGR